MAVTRFWNLPRCMLIGLFLIAWIHLSTGACHHYGHSCLGAHGKKRSEGIKVDLDSAPLSYSRILQSQQPIDSDEIDDSAIVRKGRTVEKIQHHRILPSRLIFSILMTRNKDD